MGERRALAVGVMKVGLVLERGEGMLGAVVGAVFAAFEEAAGGGSGWCGFSRT